MIGCQHTPQNTTSGSENDNHGLLRVLNQLLLFSVLGINLVYRKEQGIIGGTNVIVPFRTTLVTGTIHMTCPSDVSLTSIPIYSLDLVTNTIVGTTINFDKIR